eukprot:6197850-Pleurochrysis_carterae.AAC.3
MLGLSAIVGLAALSARGARAMATTGAGRATTDTLKVHQAIAPLGRVYQRAQLWKRPSPRAIKDADTKSGDETGALELAIEWSEPELTDSKPKTQMATYSLREHVLQPDSKAAESIIKPSIAAVAIDSTVRPTNAGACTVHA